MPETQNAATTVTAPATSTSVPTPATPVSAAIDQAETAVETQANAALSVLESDAIDFIKAAAQHAGEAIPLLTGELGNGLTELLAKAKELADKHGFKL